MIGERRVLPAADFADGVADHIEATAAAAVATRNAFHIVLAGGSTPRVVYETLADRRLDGSRWYVWWGDERWVPHEHADSNFRMAREAFLDRAPIPAEQIFPIPTSQSSPEVAAQLYEQRLREVWQGTPRFDLLLLGMGGDGHTASLFPGTSALAERKRWVVANHVPALDSTRVTLTFPALNAARQVALLVAGEGKRDRLDAVWNGTGDEPVRRVAPVDGELLWLVDDRAAERGG